MKSLWWRSAVIAAVIGIVSHVTVMAIAQTVNAPYLSLLPSTNADKAAPPALLGTKSVAAPATVQASTANTGDLAKGSAAGASKRDFKRSAAPRPRHSSRRPQSLPLVSSVVWSCWRPLALAEAVTPRRAPRRPTDERLLLLNELAAVDHEFGTVHESCLV